ncbi:MAG: hypothetical protein ABEJ27_00915 [Halodesulfurarchaeum sp.]
MNHLRVLDTDRWELPRHAHVVVYEAAAGDELLTIYDCGVTQAPPSAQLRGHLVRVRADRAITQGPTGYRVHVREPAALVAQGDDHYVIEPRDVS